MSIHAVSLVYLNLTLQWYRPAKSSRSAKTRHSVRYAFPCLHNYKWTSYAVLSQKKKKKVIYSQSQSGMLLLRRNKSAWHDTEVYQALMPGYSPASMLKKCSAHWTSGSCFQVSICVWCAIDPISICFCTLITCKTSCYRSSLSMLSSPQLCNDRDSTTALSDNGPPEL